MNTASTITLTLFILSSFTFASESGKGWVNRTGNDQLPSCSLAVDHIDKEDLTYKQAEDALECMHYIAGFFDGYSVTSGIESGRPVICFPDNSNTAQMIRVVVKWMKDHPEKLNQPASTCVFLALVDAFACKYPE